MGVARCELLSRGLTFELGSLKESLAINAITRQSEIEYLKIMAISNAIMSVGNQISAAVTGGESGGRDAFNKTLDALQELMLPHWKEEKEKKAQKAKELLAKEVSGGPIKIKAVGKEKRNGRR